MTVREDLTIDWSLSPRIIEVAAPSIELKAQDLYDTLRSLAAHADALDDDEIVEAGGKEELDDIRKVVITVSLKNAKIKFEERVAWTTCLVTGNIVAYDAYGTRMSPIEPSAYVTVDRALDVAGVLIETGVSGLTEEESAAINEIKTKVTALPSKWGVVKP